MESDGIGVEAVGVLMRYRVNLDRMFAGVEDEDGVLEFASQIKCENTLPAADKNSSAWEGEECTLVRQSWGGDGLVRDGMMCDGLISDGLASGKRVPDRIFAVADERAYVRRRNRKWAGEMAEAAFLYKAMELGLVVSKPWGDNSRYDFVVDTGKQLVRVQVKSTSCLCDGRYAVAAHGSDAKVPYSAKDIDYLVAHVPPEDAWYVIPVEAFAPHLHLWLYPRGKHAGQYEKYREAWELWGTGEGS